MVEGVSVGASGGWDGDVLVRRGKVQNNLKTGSAEHGRTVLLVIWKLNNDSAAAGQLTHRTNEGN